MYWHLTILLSWWSLLSSERNLAILKKIKLNFYQEPMLHNLIRIIFKVKLNMAHESLQIWVNKSLQRHKTCTKPVFTVFQAFTVGKNNLRYLPNMEDTLNYDHLPVLCTLLCSALAQYIQTLNSPQLRKVKWGIVFQSSKYSVMFNYRWAVADEKAKTENYHTNDWKTTRLLTAAVNLLQDMKQPCYNIYLH